MSTKKYNVLDLFCGCGGLSKGFEMAGYHILLGVDFNAPALKTYEFNHKGSKTLCGDLSSTTTFNTIDSLIGNNTVDVIKPQAHQGTFLPCNGIAMSRDMHFAFDKGFFTIDDNYNVVVSEEMKDNWFYKEYNGKRIFIPTEQFYRLNLTYLKHHRENVFNTFRQIRKL